MVGRGGVALVGSRASGRREALFLWRPFSSLSTLGPVKRRPRFVLPWTETEQSTMCRPGPATPTKLHARRDDHGRTPCPADPAHRRRPRQLGRKITRPPFRYRIP